MAQPSQSRSDAGSKRWRRPEQNTTKELSEAKAKAEGYFSTVTQEPEKNNLEPEPSGTERSEPAMAGLRERPEEIHSRQAARNEQTDANESPEGSEAGRAGSGEHTAIPC